MASLASSAVRGRPPKNCSPSPSPRHLARRRTADLRYRRNWHAHCQSLVPVLSDLVDIMYDQPPCRASSLPAAMTAILWCFRRGIVLVTDLHSIARPAVARGDAQPLGPVARVEEAQRAHEVRANHRWRCCRFMFNGELAHVNVSLPCCCGAGQSPNGSRAVQQTSLLCKR